MIRIRFDGLVVQTSQPGWAPQGDKPEIIPQRRICKLPYRALAMSTVPGAALARPSAVVPAGCVRKGFRVQPAHLHRSAAEAVDAHPGFAEGQAGRDLASLRNIPVRSDPTIRDCLRPLTLPQTGIEVGYTFC